ncbi:MAG: Bax inhibitor-1/YccA family protein [Planctomycetota bacterium]|nr:Bax inhibitor-1/YccA family protein [Planctomycetota bacterium]MDG1985088.1 Bax inhibitor-1/YccA family protein [Planctomycetota bacterium]
MQNTSNNPLLKDSVFSGTSFQSQSGALTSQMTVQGTMAKTAFLLLAVTLSAAYTWKLALEDPSKAMPWMIGGGLGGFVVAMVISFKPRLAPSLAVPYALLEGLFLGAISALIAQTVPADSGVGGGIVFQAVVLTFTTALSMLTLYAFRIIRVTERMRSIVMAATGAVMLFYLASFILGLFGVQMGMLHGSGNLSIGISLFVIGLAAFNLLLDFDFIERGARRGAPKAMEWFGAFALMVTLVWLYLEILRLLAKFSRRD